MDRKKYSKELKAQIALDAIKGQKTITELASEYGVHANQISMLLAVKKIKAPRRRRQSVIVCIKKLANCRSKLIGLKMTGNLERPSRIMSNA